jgi:hypothetical protein
MVVDDGMMIDPSSMKSVTVDPGAARPLRRWDHMGPTSSATQSTEWRLPVA